MDHVSATKSLPVTERENISGARVFDGEDQGKIKAICLLKKISQLLFDWWKSYLTLYKFSYRFRKQIQNATVTIERLVRIIDWS